MKIGIDIDGVILDFERTMRTYAELYDALILKKDGVKNKHEFNYLNRYEWTEEEKTDFINNYLVYATIHSTPLIPLSQTMLEIFDNENIEYCFITARGLIKKETKDAVINVFNRNNIDTSNIYFGVSNKVDMCKKLGIDYMIEDNPNTCKVLIDNDIKTLYFRDKDNEIISNNENIYEVSNIGEIVRFLLNVKGFSNDKEVYEKILRK